MDDPLTHASRGVVYPVGSPPPKKKEKKKQTNKQTKRDQTSFEENIQIWMCPVLERLDPVSRKKHRPELETSCSLGFGAPQHGTTVFLLVSLDRKHRVSSTQDTPQDDVISHGDFFIY